MEGCITSPRVDARRIDRIPITTENGFASQADRVWMGFNTTRTLYEFYFVKVFCYSEWVLYCGVQVTTDVSRSLVLAVQLLEHLYRIFGVARGMVVMIRFGTPMA